MLNVDGHDKGVFLTGIDSRTPLWVMVDIYGNTTGVQFIGKSLGSSSSSSLWKIEILKYEFVVLSRSSRESQQQSGAEFTVAAQHNESAERGGWQLDGADGSSTQRS